MSDRCSELKMQHRSCKSFFFFFLREKSILEQNPHTFWQTFTLNFWRKKDFFLCLSVWSLQTHRQVVFSVESHMHQSRQQQDNMLGIVTSPCPKSIFHLLAEVNRCQKKKKKWNTKKNQKNPGTSFLKHCQSFHLDKSSWSWVYYSRWWNPFLFTWQNGTWS